MINEEKNQLWDSLSRDARNVLDTLYMPYDDEYDISKVCIGEEFKTKEMEQGIVITKDLFNEIVNYVKKDKDLDWIK